MPRVLSQQDPSPGTGSDHSIGVGNFDSDSYQSACRIRDGRYKSNDARHLTSAIKRVALLSSERSRAVKLQIDAGKGG